MKQCSVCNNIQETGNFCGKCGSSDFKMIETQNEPQTNPVPPVEPIGQPQPTPISLGKPVVNPIENPTTGHSQTIHPQPVQPVQPNPHVATVTEHSKAYFNHIKTYLKNPSQIFGNGQQEFGNGLISLLLYSIILGISVYALINKAVNYAVGYATDQMDDYGFGMFTDLIAEETIKIPFFSTFFSIFFFGVVSIAIIVASLWIVSKFFGPVKSVKELISYVGVHTVPAAIVLLVGLLFLLMNSVKFGLTLTVISFVLLLLIAPLYIIARIVSFNPKSIDAFYSYLIYVLVFGVLYYIVLQIVGDITINKFLDQFTDFMGDLEDFEDLF